MPGVSIHDLAFGGLHARLAEPGAKTGAGVLVLPSRGGLGPALVHYPERDVTTKYETFQELRAALESRTVVAATVCYFHPDATHSFMEPEERIPSDAVAARTAWPGTLTFLRTALLSKRSDQWIAS